MSLATFKRKSKHKYSNATNHIGKPTFGHWIPRGPFGPDDSNTSIMLKNNMHQSNIVNGFSINGGSRTVTTGREMHNSKSRTPFRGAYPRGNGGNGGEYHIAEPVMSMGEGTVKVRGTQYANIKPTVLSTSGQLATQFRGQYNEEDYSTSWWVQPQFTGNLSDSASAGLYTDTLGSQNMVCEDVSSVTRVNAMSSSEYIKYRHRKCAVQKESLASIILRELISNILSTWNLYINEYGQGTLTLILTDDLHVPGSVYCDSIYSEGNPVSMQTQLNTLLQRINAIIAASSP